MSFRYLKIHNFFPKSSKCLSETIQNLTHSQSPNSHKKLYQGIIYKHVYVCVFKLLLFFCHETTGNRKKKLFTFKVKTRRTVTKNYRSTSRYVQSFSSSIYRYLENFVSSHSENILSFTYLSFSQ